MKTFVIQGGISKRDCSKSALLQRAKIQSRKGVTAIGIHCQVY